MDWSSAVSFGQAAATGVKDGAVSLAEGLWSLGTGTLQAGTRAATDPAYRQAVMNEAKSLADRALDYGGRLIDDRATRRQAYEQVQELAGSLKQQFVDARDLAEREGRLGEFYGKVVGRGGFEIATFIVPAAKLGALGKAGTVAKGAEAADLAKVAKGVQTLAAAKAGQAVQVCDEVVAVAPKALNPPIKLTTAGMAHVVERHTNSGIAKYANKSKFTDGEDLAQLIQRTTQEPMLTQPNGNFARVLDVGRSIGFDRQQQSITSIMTVITKPTGELVTAFPGRP